MSEQNPYERLGVTENASFEEIQAAKQRSIEQYRDDSQVLESIEAAYDAIIMDRLRMRQEGRIKVPDRIRFPEKLAEVSPLPPSVSVSKSPSWLQRAIDTPSQSDLLWSIAVFLILSILTVFSQNNSESVLPLLMAIGVCANIYLLNRKEQRLGRAVLFTVLGLLLGIGLGSGLASLLGLPSSSFMLSVEQLACLVTFGLFWLISSFLR
ncbi:molecular chaperone DnaJ [Hydrococcus rivularis NIES-593]|uniref:Molecular chaperone DnaJ n=1 Tax=Hydrococcus rivularis NIES-593 TaxID=1921803 RepID=A0A1U7HCZ3_9CYAN|nr:CPP1-like family protein [Hydrococcus rivularis]OKH21408.1 molecular chaperone DnaJ [Hydrococcus rivularis NIES-593]